MRPFPKIIFSILFALVPAISTLAEAINFDAFLKNAGATTPFKTFRENGRWCIGNNEIYAENKKAFVSINGSKIFTAHALTSASGKFFIQRFDWEKNVAPIVAPSKNGVPALRKIVIDAGHGGKDAGKINSARMQEKVVALDVAERLEKLLKARGFRVVMTRSSDRFLELSERPEVANSVWADFFVSIHFNAAESASAKGIETWVLTPVGQASFGNGVSKKAADRGNANDSWNLLAAFKIHSALVSRVNAENRGVKRANFAVLRTLKCPGVLVEAGFLTNPAEAKLIASADYREEIAFGIANGISAYAGTLSALAPSANSAAGTTNTPAKSGKLKRTTP